MNSQVQVLLVEDNPDDIELTMHALSKERFGNQVHVVCDGEEALDFLFARGKYVEREGDPYPKLILLDLKLPKVDGLEVLRQIKADSRTKHIPAVILTSSKEEQDLCEGYSLGANSYVQKPVDFDRFREIVKELGMYWLVVNQPSPVANKAEKAKQAP